MKENLRSSLLMVLAAALLASLPGCKQPSEHTRASSPSHPKTSFGKAVKSAKDLNDANEARTREMEEQMDE